MTIDQLKHICPSVKEPQQWVDLLNRWMPAYGIGSKNRIAPFIANLAVECVSFNHMLEFASGAEYQGRMGNTEPGDGIKYKGRGGIMITGKDMYKAVGNALSLDLINHPELLEQPSNAIQSACWFWAVVKDLNTIADKPDNWTRLSKNGHTYNKFPWIVRLINGGDNGLKERTEFLRRAMEVL